MERRLPALLTLFSILPVTSAQITSGYGQTRSVTGMISHLLGINIYEPYQVLGITATVGVLWVSTYVIFKVGIKKIDESLDQDGHGKSGLQDALGVDDKESRNVLAVLTLLIVLTMIGTGAFMGVISGWQSLILLAFTFALLAGTIFVIIGGTGGVIGGSAYVTGKSAQATARGVNELKDAIDEISDREERVADEENEEKDDIDNGNEDEADDEAEITAEELEVIVNMISDVEDEIDDLIGHLEDELQEDLEEIRRVVELLGEDDD